MGRDADFVLKDPAPWTVRLIEGKNFVWFRDPESARSNAGAADWLVIDDYTVGVDTEKSLRMSGARVLVFEDFPGREHDCDVLVEASGGPVSAADYRDLTPPDTALLLGPRFATLRPMFAAARKDAPIDAKPRDPGARTALWIFFGRSDGRSLTLRILEAFSDPRLFDRCVLHVVITDSTTNAPAVRAAAQSVNAVIHSEIDDMATFLSAMDFGIGAAGVGLWEMCCVGVPCLGVAVVGNQQRTLSTAVRLGLADPLPPPDQLSPEDLVRRICAFLDSSDDRAENAARARRLVDGRGARRIAAMLSGLAVRPATIDDAELLWGWANDPTVRQNAIQGAQIRWDDHLTWFSAKLSDPESRIFIGTISDSAIGQVRFDIDRRSDEAEIDISLAPEWRGKGLATGLLLHAEAVWRGHFPTARPIARVKTTNHSSLAVFRAAGYIKHSSQPESALVTLSAAP